MSGARHWEQDKDSTVYVGNLDERCTDALVWELMLQAGPIINVHLPKDRVTQIHQGYGFIEFGSEEDADYAVKIMNQIRVWGKLIRVNKASADKRGMENGGIGGGSGIGAELFVGNLDPMVTEKTLLDTFSRFGPLLGAPKIAKDDSNLSKGYGFVSFSDFDHSDEAIQQMHGQYLMNREVTVQYAYKKDGKGERHGDSAERSLAAQAKKHGVKIDIPAMPAALMDVPDTPSAPAAMNNYPQMPNGIPSRPQPPPSYGGYGAYGMPVGYNHMPPPAAATILNGAPPVRQFNQSPLQAPPSGAGLPARPPPSMGGYGGPPNAPGILPNFQGAGLPPPPMNFPPSGPPAGMPPPGLPPGFRPPPNGFPPGSQR